MYLYLVLFTIGIAISDAYRILCVFPFGAKSHNIVFGAVSKSLAKHGHHVDVISHYPQKIPVKNLYDIMNLSDPMQTYIDSIKFHDLFQRKDDVSKLAEIYGNRLCHFMGSRSMQRLIKNPPRDPPYDLVITEALFAHCYIGLGYIFKVPVITISSGMEFPWITYFTGNSDNLAFVPNILYHDNGRMNLYGRIKNVLINYIAMWDFQRTTEKSQTDSMRKYLSVDMPNIREIEKSVALTLVNNHPTLFGIKPVTPALIQIAGLHIEANDETLPTELKFWLDESTSGVVYFSLGTIVPIETLPANMLKDVYASLRKMSPIRVLMKIVNRSSLLPGLPKNIKILSWIPQQSVLGHPNVKGFINHGGLGGVQEAIYYGVPMIAMPLFSDQFRNVDYLISKKIIIKINIEELSEEALDSALKTILHNPIYRENAAYYSKLFRDQPINCTSKAVFWIEYVIRHGADALRSPALQLSTIQLTLIDVYGVILIVIFCVFFALIFSAKIIASALVKWLLTRKVKKSAKYKEQSNKIV